jgi:hypothetical protein
VNDAPKLTFVGVIVDIPKNPPVFALVFVAKLRVKKEEAGTLVPSTENVMYPLAIE